MIIGGTMSGVGGFLPQLKTGATSGGSGSSTDDLWVTSSHVTLPDGVVIRA